MRDVVDREASEFALHPVRFRGDSGLVQINVVKVDSHHAVGAAFLHLNRIKTRVAADIQHRLAAQVGGQRMREASPFNIWVIPQKMIGGSVYASEIQIMKPSPQFLNALLYPGIIP